MAASFVHTFNAAETPIQSVTVYKNNKAQVVRFFNLEITAPENHVVITNLPNVIDASSIRVSGLSGAARLIDVSCKIPATSTARSSDALHALTQRKKTLVAEKGIREEEAKILIAYGNSLCKDHASYAELTQFLEVFRAELAKRAEATRELEEQICAVEAQIAAETDSGTKGWGNAKVTISLVAGGSCSNFSLRFTYHVSDASWKPIYDLRALSTNVENASLHYRAVVAQSTGENWTNTQLMLNTADGQSQDVLRLGTYSIRSFNGLRPPVTTSLFGTTDAPVPAWKIYQQAHRALVPAAVSSNQPAGLFGSQPKNLFVNGISPLLAAHQSTSAMSVTPLSDLELGGATGSTTTTSQSASTADHDVPHVAQLETLSEGSMVVQTSSLSSSFTVQESVTIPSDDVNHTVHVASFTCQAEITRVCVPRLSANVLFQCRVENVTQYKLLPGTISVFLDEEYDIGLHDSFECALGVDPSLQVSYERAETRKFVEAISFSNGSKDVTSCKAKTTVINTGADTVKGLVIRDVFPILGASDADHLNVSLRQPQALLNVSAAGQDIDVMAHVVIGETNRTRLEGLKRTVRWEKKEGKSGGRDEGKYEWVVDILSNEEITIVAEWDVKVPSGWRWHEVEEA